MQPTGSRRDSPHYSAAATGSFCLRYAPSPSSVRRPRAKLMEIEARGLIYDASGRPGPERIAFFTSLCPLQSGVILAGFQVGPSKHAPTATIRLCRSRDGGVTWTEIPGRFETTLYGAPGSLAAGELVEVEAGRLLL